MTEKCRVHRLETKREGYAKNLRKILKDLEDEFISIITNIKKDSLPQIYGMSEKVDFLMIAEKI